MEENQVLSIHFPPAFAIIAASLVKRSRHTLVKEEDGMVYYMVCLRRDETIQGLGKNGSTGNGRPLGFGTLFTIPYFRI